MSGLTITEISFENAEPNVDTVAKTLHSSSSTLGTAPLDCSTHTLSTRRSNRRRSSRVGGIGGSEHANSMRRSSSSSRLEDPPMGGSSHGRLQRRSSLSRHNEDNMDKVFPTNHDRSKDKRRSRSSNKRLSSSHRSKSSNRLGDSDSALNLGSVKLYDKNDQSKEARRSRRRRNSVATVQTKDSDDASVQSSKSLRSLKVSLKNVNPFGRRDSDKDNKKKSHKKKSHKDNHSSFDDLLHNMEEMEHLVKVLKRNPDSRKILNNHLREELSFPPREVTLGKV